jgi:hypothetical protein
LAPCATLNLSSLDGSNGFKLSGVAADDISGRSVASAGDVNGDGFADPNGGASGASYVVFGQATIRWTAAPVSTPRITRMPRAV